MPRTLDVYLLGMRCGLLTQEDTGEIVFAYAPEWLAREAAFPISQSLPLRSKSFLRKECQGFFGGLLPEADQRDLVAKTLGISKQNDFSMLEIIGRECAGAVSFYPAGEELDAKTTGLRVLDEADLADALRRLPRRPLLAGEEGIRLSLAGAQSKLPLTMRDGVFSLPLGGQPSTHILKPPSPHFEHLIENEHLCMSLAQAVGLPVAKVEVRAALDMPYLLIERYDRAVDETGSVRRLHQEDFCQALGIPSSRKYQSEGGPSLPQCFDLVRRVVPAPITALQTLLDAVIFNFVIGNHDAHGKNFSLLYRQKGKQLVPELAPLYDLVCTAHYADLAKKMAMRIGTEYRSERVYPPHFERFAADAGLSPALVRKRVVELGERILDRLDQMELLPGQDAIADTIRGRGLNVLRRFTNHSNRQMPST